MLPVFFAPVDRCTSIRMPKVAYLMLEYLEGKHCSTASTWVCKSLTLLRFAVSAGILENGLGSVDILHYILRIDRTPVKSSNVFTTTATRS